MHVHLSLLHSRSAGTPDSNTVSVPVQRQKYCEEGTQEFQPQAVEVAADGRSVELRFDVRPVDQLRLWFEVDDAGGKPFEEEVYWTIHAVP